MSESGEPIVLEEDCRHCGRNRPTGNSWFDDINGWYFKCDECGRQMFLGYAESDNQAMVDAKRDYERSIENRSRYIREKDEEAKEHIHQALERLQTPDHLKTYQFLFDPARAARKEEMHSDRDTLDNVPLQPFVCS
jgi:hypothetical protein